jgi:head-tail adaptor
VTRSFYNDTIIRRRAAFTIDAYGNEVKGTATDLAISGCRVQPTETNEMTSADRDMVQTQLQVFCPSGADVIATDQIVWQNVVYEVVGDLQEYRSPTGVANHSRFRMVKLNG